MAISIIEKIRESSGQWRVRLSIDNTESIFLWFPSDVTLEEARIVVTNYLQQRAADRADQQADADNKQTLRAALAAYTPATGNAATRALLEAVIARLKARDNL